MVSPLSNISSQHGASTPRANLSENKEQGEKRAKKLLNSASRMAQSLLSSSSFAQVSLESDRSRLCIGARRETTSPTRGNPLLRKTGIDLSSSQGREGRWKKNFQAEEGLALALTRIEEGTYSEAITLAKRYAFNSAVGYELRAEAICVIAKACRKSGDPKQQKQAIKSIAQALVELKDKLKDPKAYAQLYIEMSKAQRAVGDFEEAAKAIEVASQLTDLGQALAGEIAAEKERIVERSHKEPICSVEERVVFQALDDQQWAQNALEGIEFMHSEGNYREGIQLGLQAVNAPKVELMTRARLSYWICACYCALGEFDAAIEMLKPLVVETGVELELRALLVSQMAQIAVKKLAQVGTIVRRQIDPKVQKQIEELLPTIRQWAGHPEVDRQQQKTISYSLMPLLGVTHHLSEATEIGERMIDDSSASPDSRVGFAIQTAMLYQGSGQPQKTLPFEKLLNLPKVQPILSLGLSYYLAQAYLELGIAEQSGPLVKRIKKQLKGVEEGSLQKDATAAGRIKLPLIKLMRHLNPQEAIELGNRFIASCETPERLKKELIEEVKMASEQPGLF